MMNKNFYTVRGYELLQAERKMLTSSMEDYLEMIYRISMEEGYARINQLSEKLNVRPSSTTKVVQRLGRLNLVDYEKYGVIKLTEKGEEIGKYLLDRHEIIQEFLRNFGAEDTLLRDTELMEHCISSDTLQSMYIFNEFLLKNQDIKKQYKSFKKNYYAHDKKKK